ncbi:MAG: hypothetical protein OZ924_08025 [Burkholderiaceae bacterium]|nr:hypothetical protein [Burkholderiaceae bacterium]
MFENQQTFHCVPSGALWVEPLRLRRVLGIMCASLMSLGISACGDLLFGDSSAVTPDSAISTASATPSNVAPGNVTNSNVIPVAAAAPAKGGVTASNPGVSTDTRSGSVASQSWQEIALRDMRAPDGSYALNDDRLLHRRGFSPEAGGSSQYLQASLVMGRYGTSAAFTRVNPDYEAQLSYLSADNPARSLARWPLIILWDQIYLSERFGPNHAAGYTGNSRVRTWGYEMWIKNKAGVWRREFKTDEKGAEAWRPTFQGSANFDPSAHDLRKEPDGSYSARPMPALGFDSSGSYWISHGYAGGRRTIDPDDVADVLVLCYSQLVLNDPNGIDDRQYARFLYAVGADWVPPADRRSDVTLWPSVGVSRHKYVKSEPTLHVMHTMTEAEFRANPPPR